MIAAARAGPFVLPVHTGLEADVGCGAHQTVPSSCPQHRRLSGTTNTSSLKIFRSRERLDRCCVISRFI